ncbi:hypothetical protein ACQEU8_02385 [Streptomyces sp. CA-250714]|uniref:hypothetical protein n=1 Tax=Streptomyces sp. CA-250714 TaxID=3240060 RepID=UPI003D8DDCEF
MARDIANGDTAWRAVVYVTQLDGSQRRYVFGAYALKLTAWSVLDRKSQTLRQSGAAVTGYIERATITWERA